MGNPIELSPGGSRYQRDEGGIQKTKTKSLQINHNISRHFRGGGQRDGERNLSFDRRAQIREL